MNSISIDNNIWWNYGDSSCTWDTQEKGNYKAPKRRKHKSQQFQVKFLLFQNCHCHAFIWMKLLSFIWIVNHAHVEHQCESSSDLKTIWWHKIYIQHYKLLSDFYIPSFAKFSWFLPLIKLVFNVKKKKSYFVINYEN